MKVYTVARVVQHEGQEVSTVLSIHRTIRGAQRRVARWNATSRNAGERLWVDGTSHLPAGQSWQVRYDVDAWLLRA